MVERGILHGVSLSPFVRKTRAVLAIKSIEYELVNVMPGAMDADFLAISPLSKVPVWEEEGWTLPDSSVICSYLERTNPEPPVYPSDPREYATALFWEEYADTRLVESAGPVFFQLVVRERIFKQPAEQDIVRRQIDEVLPPVFDQLEALYVETVDPSKITISTLSVWAPFVGLDHAGYRVDAKIWPGLANFLTVMGAHPVLRALVEEERAGITAFQTQ